MNHSLGKTCALWTGGKDSCFALYEALSLGYQITSLITFTPPRPQFRAHPLHVMKYQAETLQLPHSTVEITEPFEDGYRLAFQVLKKQFGVSAVITGDIDEIQGHPNWIREYAAANDIETVTPLWKRNRSGLLEKLMVNNFKVIFSCVKRPWFDGDWLGTELNAGTVDRLHRLHEATGIDVCGENGEYHTIVLDCPLFQRKICVEDSSKESNDSLLYLNLRKLSFVNK